mgnify:CR=1 FL=1
MPRKYLFLIADGMGDWPLEQLDGRTPLMVAETLNIDALARTGLAGRCLTIPLGMPPGSDVANMSLLGFDPGRYHTGRGPIEAAAQGLTLDPDDLVWRLNLVTVSALAPDGLMRDYSAGHVTTPVATALIQRLRGALAGHGLDVIPGVQYRHLLVQKGAATGPEATLHIRPPHDILDQPLGPDLEALATCPALDRFVCEATALLAQPGNTSAANAVWPWGQGRPLLLPNFTSTYGLRGAVISAVDLVRGLGLAAGMEVLQVPGVTGLLDTNYEGKVVAALDFLERGDFVYLHVEAPDECGHGGDVAGKIEAIHRFDERIVGPLRRALEGTDTAFLVACDHLTPIVLRTHASDPAPFLLSWESCAGGDETFDETRAEASGLVVDPGHMLLRWVMNRVDAAANGGAA